MLVDLGVASPVQTVALVLAQVGGPPADKGEEFGKASPVGLVVVLLLGIATVLLVRSMAKRLRRLPESFDRPTDEATTAAPDTPSPPIPAAAPDDDRALNGTAPRTGDGPRPADGPRPSDG